MSWYILMLKRWNDFSGRSRRQEYWMAFLFNLILGFVVRLIDRVLGSNVGGLGIGILSILFTLILLIPSVAVAIRRLHDTGRSGWWIFIALIPIVGAIVLIVWLAKDGQRADNQYGSDPKLAGAPV